MRRSNTPPRDRAVDALRGLAVVLMVAWHLTDGWLADSARAGPGWHAARVLGGVAAPLFIAVAGISVGLALQRGLPLLSVVRRGLSIVALGGLLRMQLWLVDAGGLLAPEGWLAMATGLLGYGAVLYGLRAQARPRERRVALLGLGLLVAFVWRVHADVPEHAARILAVDVLQCIGASVMIAAVASRAVVWLCASSELLSTTLLLGAGLAVVACEPVLADLLTGGPATATAWLVRTPDVGQETYARFPIAPWCAYALVGCAVARARRPSPTALIAGGLALSMFAFEGGLPWVRRLLQDAPAARSFAHLFFMCGAMTVFAGVALACVPATVPPRPTARSLPVASRALVTLGRASLPIYWIHLELAYGLPAVPIARSVAPVGCAIGTCAVLLAAVLFASRRRSASPFAGPARLASR